MRYPEYIYADGNANRYQILPDRLRYIPVKPEESSTGNYSGGEPADISLSAADYQKLQNLFEQVSGQTEQPASRIKGSSLIIAGSQQFILKPGNFIGTQLEIEFKKLIETFR